jgi:hypothetical protein
MPLILSFDIIKAITYCGLPSARSFTRTLKGQPLPHPFHPSGESPCL